MAETVDLLHVYVQAGATANACPVLMQVTVPEEIQIIMIFNSFENLFKYIVVFTIYISILCANYMCISNISIKNSPIM